MYNLRQLYSEVFSTPTSAQEWAFQKGLIPREKKCPQCKDKMMQFFPLGIERGEFRCNSHQSRIVRGLWSGTWFEGTKLSMGKVLTLTYCIANKFSQEQVIRETSFNDETSTETVADWSSYCREVMMIDLDRMFQDQGKIGGVGKIVEIDESKIGKRKYQVGRVVEGSWVFGMIERGDGGKFRLEICPNNKRDKETLLALIKKHIEPGTTIYSDCWKSYDCLDSEGYLHFTVNHTLNFVDPTTGAHTQKIESNWRPLKKRLTRGGITKDKLADHLCEYLWMRAHPKDRFFALIEAIKLTYKK